ncbi:hypothetical protein QE152_g38269 [Popillia japonica]|uniref:Uncharacterized protein n=1 Tax=Popillia japonica TaxID=7064 RepID=A0AAW1I8F7_POPJA
MFQERGTDDENALRGKDSELSRKDVFIDDCDSFSEQSVSEQEIEEKDSVASNSFIGKTDHLQNAGYVVQVSYRRKERQPQ